MVLIHHLKSAKYLQPSYPSLGYMSWRGNTAPIFLVMALINRSESLYWELMPLQGTRHWRSYIKTACEIGLPVMLFIQVVHKAGSSSQVPVDTFYL
jgi:hypothetical protein